MDRTPPRSAARAMHPAGLVASVLALVVLLGLLVLTAYATFIQITRGGPGVRLMAIDRVLAQRVAPMTVEPPPAEPQLVETGAFNNRPLRKIRDVDMLVTAYSPDARSCGKWADGVTASGYSVWTNGMRLVAADTDLLPFGSVVSVPGYNGGQPVPVLDRGGRIKGQRLDVLYPTHETALRWGAQRLTVTIWEYAD